MIAPSKALEILTARASWFSFSTCSVGTRAASSNEGMGVDMGGGGEEGGLAWAAMPLMSLAHVRLSSDEDAHIQSVRAFLDGFCTVA